MFHAFRPSGHRARVLILAATLVTVLGLGVWDCARASEKSRTKVLLIGIDAGEWDVLGPLLDQKKVPAFAYLRDQGASGKLRSLEPLTKSPIIWASIATGKVPSKHGINDFLVKRTLAERANETKTGNKPADSETAEGDPITSNLWRARPVWDILGSLGKKVGVVGWWTTWPAQPVNGTLVTDYAAYGAGQWPGHDTHRTYPEGLDSLVTKYRRDAKNVSWAELFQFVPPIDTTKVTARQNQLMDQLRWIYASDMTFYRVGMELYKRDHPDFFTVYFRGVDAASHAYWDIDMPGPHGNYTDAEYQWLKNLIPNYYIFTDRMIGNFLKEAGSKTNVIVNSDHGFQGGGIGVMAHKVDGIVLMAGPEIRKDANISGATVLDITPTVLALFGLPTAQDMDGRPIADALQANVAKKVERMTKLKTYETAQSATGKNGEPLRSPVDQELRERLRSLGYLQ